MREVGFTNSLLGYLNLTSNNFSMLELITILNEATNLLAHGSAGLAMGDILRERLSIKETTKLARTSDKVADSVAATYPDADLIPRIVGRGYRTITSLIGNHRGNLHIPWVDGPIGFAGGCGYYVMKNIRDLKNLDYSKLLKNGLISAASALTHPLIDYLSGGGVPYAPGRYVSFHSYRGNEFSTAFHLSVVCISLLALYCSHRKRK